jgi:hypothetical protein
MVEISSKSVYFVGMDKASKKKNDCASDRNRPCAAVLCLSAEGWRSSASRLADSIPRPCLFAAEPMGALCLRRRAASVRTEEFSLRRISYGQVTTLLALCSPHPAGSTLTWQGALRALVPCRRSHGLSEATASRLFSHGLIVLAALQVTYRQSLREF